MKLTSLELGIMKCLIKYKFDDEGTVESTTNDIIEIIKEDAKSMRSEEK